MSRHSKKTPVIIGVGDIINRSKKVEDAIEPLQLMLLAIQEAIKDTGLDASAATTLQSSIDSIDVTRSWTWPCDYPTLLGQKLSCNPLHKGYSTEHGGNQPALLLDNASRRVSTGETKVAVVTGGEALASCEAFHLGQCLQNR